MTEKKIIYFDNSATTRVDDKVSDVVLNMMLENFGNPSSLHFKGTDALTSIYKARCQVAQVIGARTNDIYFTSGGTESNNMAIIGGAYANMDSGRTIVTTAIEHSSVLNAVNHLRHEGFNIKIVEPDKSSHCIRAQDVIDAVDDDTIIVSVMHINNETGEILPIRDIVRGVKEKNPKILVHCDCVQSFGKYPFRLHEAKVDMISASAHKLHGPKGIGAIYIRDKSRVRSLIYGGKQEKGLRPGTENTPAICGFGEACKLALVTYKEFVEHMKVLKGTLVSNLQQYDFIKINTPSKSAWNIVNFSVIGASSEKMVNYFADRDIYLSAGSACEKGARSHVLEAAGYDDEIISGALRISFSKYNTVEEVLKFNEYLDSYIENNHS